LIPGCRNDVRYLFVGFNILSHWNWQEPLMDVGKLRTKHKNARRDVTEIKRALRSLKAGTQAETLERASDAVIAERERNRLTREANERFLKSGIEITDVYGKLAE
jgi:phage terminase Nu1 subunit (DNA packaging protein)